MKVLVYGAGAVGSYLGASLAKAGEHEVTLVTRPIAIDILREQGLTVRAEKTRYKWQPEAVASVRQAFLDGRTYDLILLTVKSYDVSDALNPLLAFCPDPPPIITLQNGIGLEELVAAQVGAEKVIAASLTTPVSQETPERLVVERLDRGLALAPTVAAQDIEPYVALFQGTDIATMAVADYRSMKWSKALLNMLGNASAAILNRHPEMIYKYRPTFDIEMDMLKEAIAVMRKLKLEIIDLPGTSTSRLSRAVRFVPRAISHSILTRMIAEGRGNKMPSFQLDVMSGRRRNEVQFHNVAVAEHGRELGVPTPVNAALGYTLMGIVRGEIDHQEYIGQPQRLEEEVERYRQEAKS